MTRREAGPFGTRRRRRRAAPACSLLALVTAGLLLAGCGTARAPSSSSPGEGGREPTITAPRPGEATPTRPGFTLSSPAFAHGARLPARFATADAGGSNTSPPLSWSGAPAGTKSFALVCVDRHPVANDWVHWLVVNIPASATGLEEGASPARMPAGALELVNGYGQVGWGGPEPPPGTGDHDYEFTLYALSVPELDLLPRATLEEFEAAIEGKVLGTAVLVGKYAR